MLLSGGGSCRVPMVGLVGLLPGVQGAGAQQVMGGAAAGLVGHQQQITEACRVEPSPAAGMEAIPAPTQLKGRAA